MFESQRLFEQMKRVGRTRESTIRQSTVQQMSQANE
jgi:hypothetical protein